MNLLDLPEVVMENIFSYMTHDEIAKCRIVCQSFNELCQRLLNRGFVVIERKHGLALRNVKMQLPRRESERRYHPLSRHCDILSSIETRISMLNMTYSKFIDSGMCCFIPGKVIDEISRVLVLVERSGSPPRAHEVLQELRDISSMAIEHFDEQVAPALRRRLQQRAAAAERAPRPHAFGPLALTQELYTMRRRTIVNTRLSLHLASQYKKFKRQISVYKKTNMKQRKIIRDLNKKQNEQEASIADLKKRIEECDIKYSEITHTNQPAKTMAEGAAGPAGARHFASQIKLDLSVLPIGTSKRTQRGPNMKPRKSACKLPVAMEDAEKSQKSSETQKTSETPNTSETQNTSKTQSTSEAQNTSCKTSHKSKSIMGTIEDCERDLRMLCKNDIYINRSGKRSLSLNALDDEGPSKKSKLD